MERAQGVEQLLGHDDDPARVRAHGEPTADDHHEGADGHVPQRPILRARTRTRPGRAAESPRSTQTGHSHRAAKQAR
jgi:hypothetical protein